MVHVSAIAALCLLLTTAALAQPVVTCPKFFNVPAALNATAWSKCPNQTDASGAGHWNFGEFQCRTIWYPATYLINGTTAVQRNSERRFVKGTPTSIVYLISGGPGMSSDGLALATAKQIDNALQDNYAVYIPALRGSGNTASFTEYAGFPADLYQRLRNQTRNFTDYSVTNTAMDLVLSMRNTKEQYKTATLNAIGFSFGGYIVQRILAIQPALLASAILDSPPAPVNGTNAFAAATLGADPLATAIMANCARNPLCNARSLSRTELVQFLNEMETKSNPCVDAFVNTFGLPPAAPKDQIISSLLYALLSINLGLPKSVLALNPASAQYRYEVIKAIIATGALDSRGSDAIYIDSRAITLAFLNQLAQCSYGNPARLASFQNALATLRQVIGVLLTIANPDFASTSVFGVKYITNLLVVLSEGRYPWITLQEGREQAESSFLRPPVQIYDAEAAYRTEIAKFPWFRDCYSNKFPVNVQARVIFLGGRLDTFVPIQETQRAFRLMVVNARAGGKKSIFIHNNGGHTVIGFGYSPCTLLLIRGVILKNTAVIAQYQRCLAQENSKPIDWALDALPRALNVTTGIWDGLTARFSHAPTRSPTRKPSKSPTVKPSASPTGKQTASPTSVAPSRSPTTFKAFCNAIKNQTTCRASGCIWRSVRQTCTPD
jgi:pimeloyl-ACP methyl ester carboxylesterase